ncbi:MAG: hypothetical protein IPO67_19300 [Deltaproteobacteria bacterium]|nr:hypothetical protein [Deltaproteobacteria bacterium]
MGLDYRVRCCPDGLVTDRRRRIRVLDCTIRDGGICNDWHFDEDLVARTAAALDVAGVDYMEIGYRSRDGAFSREKKRRLALLRRGHPAPRAPRESPHEGRRDARRGQGRS